MNTDTVCFTCGYWPNTDNLTIAERDHMDFDGAHYPNWIDDSL